MALGVLRANLEREKKGLRLEGGRRISPKFLRSASPGKLAPRLLHGNGFRLGEGRHLDASRLRMRAAEISNFK